jgi:hypothetical protein
MDDFCGSVVVSIIVLYLISRFINLFDNGVFATDDESGVPNNEITHWVSLKSAQAAKDREDFKDYQGLTELQLRWVFHISHASIPWYLNRSLFSLLAYSP